MTHEDKLKQVRGIVEEVSKLVGFRMTDEMWTMMPLYEASTQTLIRAYYLGTSGKEPKEEHRVETALRVWFGLLYSWAYAKVEGDEKKKQKTAVVKKVWVN